MARIDSPGKATVFYQALRDDLVSGKLAPGQRLSEASLSREYGVSRSPVREGLARLEHDGLVERRGMVVRVPERSVGEILDIYQVRVFLEGAIAADAAERRSEIDLLRLDGALRVAKSARRREPADLVAANRSFHDALTAASHNASLRDLQQRLTAQIATLPATTLSWPGRWRQACAEHARIVAAVRERDARAARSLAEEHMRKARDIRIQLYELEYRPAR